MLKQLEYIPVGKTHLSPRQKDRMIIRGLTAAVMVLSGLLVICMAVIFEPPPQWNQPGRGNDKC